MPGSRTGTGFRISALKRLKIAVVGADAEGDGQDGRGRKYRGTPESAQAVAQVLHEALPPDPHRHLAHVVAHIDGIAERLERGAPCLVGCQARLDVFRCRLLDMEGDI